MTDSQVSVAKRDSAKALFKTFLDARGGHLQVRWPHNTLSHHLRACGTWHQRQQCQ